MIQIVINNTFVDVDPDISVPLNFQASRGDNIGEVLANYTNTFNLPATDRNLELMENAQSVASNSRVPYKALSAKLIINGRDLFGVSQIVILEISEQNIRCAFLAGNKSVDLTGSIRDLDLSELNFTFTPANAAARSASATGVVWAPVNYGVDVLPTTVDIDRCYFGVYMLAIFQQMFKQANTVLTIKNQTGTFFNRMILMVSEPKAFYTAEMSFRARRSADFTTVAGANTVKFDVVTSGNEGGGYNPVTGIFANPNAAKTTVGVRLRILAPNTSQVTVRLQGGGLTATLTQTSDGVTELDFTIGVADATVPALSGFFVEVINTVGTATVRAIGSTFNVAVSRDLVAGNTIDIAASLPDISQGEIFSSIARMNNLIVTSNNGVSQVMAFDRLAVSTKYDFSSKLDTSIPPVTLFQSALGQITNFRYSNDAFSPSPTAGDAAVEFDNDVLPPSVDAVKLLYAGARDTIFCNVLSIAMPANTLEPAVQSGTCGRNGGAGSFTIQFSSSHGLKVGDYFTTDDDNITYYVVSVFDALNVNVEKVVANINGSPWTKIKITRNSLTTRIAFTDENSVVQPTVTYRGTGGTATATTIRRVMFIGDGAEGLSWKKLLTNYFVLWLGAMARYQLVRAMFKLNDNDVYQFDFSNTIYVEKFGTEFYVQAINKYIGSEESTEMELLALAEGFNVSKITDL